MPLTRPVFPKVTLDTSVGSPTHEEGLIFYDNVNKTVGMYNDEAEITLQVGQEMWVRVYNNTGSTITNGQVVYISGTDTGFPAVSLARADALATCESVIGLTTHDIETGTYGYVTSNGTVRDVDTSSYTIGDRLYLSPTVAGALTTTKPTSQDEFIVEVGIVSEVNAATGTILVDIDFNTQISAESVNLLSLGNATYDSLQQMQDIYHSAGWADGGTFSDGGAGTLDVATGSGYLRAVDSLQATLFAIDWPAVTGLALTDNSENFIYVEYNGGTPQVVATITQRQDLNTNIYLGNVYREGTELHINETVRFVVADHAGKMIQRLQEISPYARASGAVISETGTRNIAITSGVFWEGLTRYTTGAFDSSGADTFTTVYRDGVGGFTFVDGVSQVSNSQYDDGSGTLATLSNNYYGVHWVYLSVDDHVYVVYGQSNNQTLAAAEGQSAPSSADLPDLVKSHSRIVGKLIVQEGTTAFIDVQTAFEGGGFTASGSQNLYESFTGDTGTTTANTTTDTLNIVGGTNIVTAATTDTVTINQEEIVISTVSTTDATPTEMTPYVDVPSDSTVTFSALIVARRTDADNESAGYKLEGVIDNNAGTTALVGTVTKSILAEDSAAWDVSATADDTNDRLAITVTGEAAKNISWRAKINYNSLTG